MKLRSLLDQTNGPRFPIYTNYGSQFNYLWLIEFRLEYFCAHIPQGEFCKTIPQTNYFLKYLMLISELITYFLISMHKPIYCKIISV